jgi:hypothetical protein
MQVNASELVSELLGFTLVMHFKLGNIWYQKLYF